MKWCVIFPEEDILIKRPSLKKACGGNKAAATFLSYLLYQVSISREYKKTAENMNKRQTDSEEKSNQQLVTGSVYRTQLQIIEEIDNELSDRTLRDTAIPWLIALGYIEVDDSHPINIYVVHVERVQKAINHPPDGFAIQEVKERFQSLTGKISDAQANGKTSVSNGKTSDATGKTSVSNGKTSVSNGKTSDGKSGTQRTPQAAPSGVLRRHKNNKSNYDSIRIEESNADSVSTTQEAANAATLSLLSLVEKLSLEELDLVLQKLQEQRQQHSPSVETPPTSDETAQSSSVQENGPTSSVQEQPQATGSKGKQGQKTTRTRKGSKEVALTLQGQHILELYDGFKGRKVARSPETIRAANGLGDVVSSDEDFELVLKAIANDTFLKQKQVRIDLDFVYRKYDGFLDIVELARKKQPDGAKSVAGSQSSVAVESGKPQGEPTVDAETYVLWTRDTDNPVLREFVNTPRGKKWYELAALIVWEGMTETEAMQYGWEPGNSMTDHETRMIAYAQQRRQEEREVQEVHA